METSLKHLQGEKAGKGRKPSKRMNWEKILESQIETGTPYMLYKDAANRKSNQRI
jgi:ribonucleoside-diphosphate reductase alpha chain